MQTIATPFPKDSQCGLILEHLTKIGPLSIHDAARIYRIAHPPRRICDLRDAGWRINTVMMKDGTGRRHAVYYLEN